VRRALRRWLGDTDTRRRRHRRVAVVAAALLAVAAVLVFVLDDGDAGFEEEATAVCEDFSDRIQREFALSFPEGAPSAEAEAEYLSHAFADSMDELVVELRALDGASDDATAAIDDLEVLVADIRADPATYVEARENPFAADVAPAFDAAGLPACGSEFFPAPS
jgi:hypothetical protein